MLAQYGNVTSSPTPVPTYTWTYNYSSTANPGVDLSVNGSGTAYAFACQAASASYLTAMNNFYGMDTASTVPTYVSSYSVARELWDIWTTDCDGIPHARGTAPTATTTIWSTTTYTNFAPAAVTSYTGASPTCRIQPTDCGAVQSSYSKELQALSEFTATLTPPLYVTNAPMSPQCSTVCTASQICMIRGDEVRLIYWPVTTTGADSCRRHGTTVSASFTGEESIVTLGTTFYSPTAYISFRSLWAWDWGCYTTIGRAISNTILPIDPKSLSSAQGNHLGRSAVSFNLADLNGFVSSKAFFQMQPYDWYPRKTIYDDLYRPIIWMPEEVLSFRPEWKGCGLSIFGIEDPPLALTTAEYLDPPYGRPTATSKASPAHSLSDWGPTATPTAEADHTSTSPSSHSSKVDPSRSASSKSPVSTTSRHPGPNPSKAPASDCVSIASEGIVYQSTTYSFSSSADESDAYTGGWYSVATASAGSSYAIVAGSTAWVAGPDITVAGHTVSAGTQGIVVDASQTIAFAAAATSAAVAATTSGPASEPASDPASNPSSTTAAAEASADTASSTGEASRSQAGSLFALVCALLALSFVT